MLKKICVLIIIVSFLVTGCVSTVSGMNTATESLRFWYYEPEDPDEVLIQVLRELRNFAIKQKVEVEYVKYDGTKVSLEDYKKKLSIALSTGECDVAYTDIKTLSTFEKSLMSLDNSQVYQTLLPTLNFGKFLPLQYSQPIYGLNKDVLEEYGIEYSEDIDIHEFFRIKNEYRQKGGFLELDGIELEQLIDEFIIPREIKADLSNVDYQELYEDYQSILDMVYSGSYDYSDMEVKGYYISWNEYKSDRAFQFTNYSGYSSNRLNKSGLKYLSADFFIPYTDIRFMRNARDEWRQPGLGVSLFGKNKEVGVRFVEQMLGDSYMKSTYSKGNTVLTGYEGIKPQRYNELLNNYVEEKKAYEAAAASDARYDFAKVNLGDLFVRDQMLWFVYTSIQNHKRLKYDDFYWDMSAAVMEYMVTMGER